MGVTNRLLDFLVIASTSQKSYFEKIDYERTLTLGRQYCLFSKADLSRILCASKANPSSVDNLWQRLEATPLGNNRTPGAQKYAEPLLEFLGAEVVDSIDISDYEMLPS